MDAVMIRELRIGDAVVFEDDRSLPVVAISLGEEVARVRYLSGDTVLTRHHGPRELVFRVRREERALAGVG